MKSATLALRAREWWKRDIGPFFILALVLFSIRSSLADWNDVPTGSMKPTIVEGDRIFVNKLAYDLKVPFTTWRVAEWSNPERGDIVVFHSPFDETRLVKRVIGLPGDIIELRNERLLISSEPVTYARLRSDAALPVSETEKRKSLFAIEHLPGQSHPVMILTNVAALRSYGPLVVPEGNYFVMGDNRDNSFDSRFFGCVERDRILGKATGVAFSLQKENHWLPRRDRFVRPLNSPGVQ